LTRTFRCIFRSWSPDDRIGTWMRANQTSFLSSYPNQPKPSKILSEDELHAYVAAYQKSGFRASLNWYATSYLNWLEEAELPVKIHQPCLMVTAGYDKILTPSLAADMEKWMPNLHRAHIEETGHWVQMEQSDSLNRILLDFLQSLERKTERKSAGIPSKL